MITSLKMNLVGRKKIRIMDIENKIFQRYSPDFDKLEEYGFVKENGSYKLEKLFKGDLFKAVIVINSNGQITGIVYDIENDDEFLPLRVEGLNGHGAFVGEIREAYANILKNIREKCFIKKYYIYPQSNRITNLVIKKYGNEPEFLWKTTPGSGIFRNPDSKKWYLAILDVDRSKIQKNTKGLVEIALIKLTPDNVAQIIKQEHFYPGWHMNKKYWITVILDDTVDDDKIMQLIEESHSFTIKKK